MKAYKSKGDLYASRDVAMLATNTTSIIEVEVTENYKIYKGEIEVEFDWTTNTLEVFVSFDNDDFPKGSDYSNEAVKYHKINVKRKHYLSEDEVEFDFEDSNFKPSDLTEALFSIIRITLTAFG